MCIYSENNFPILATSSGRTSQTFSPIFMGDAFASEHGTFPAGWGRLQEEY